MEISLGEAKSPRKKQHHTGTREVHFSATVQIHMFLGRAAVLQVRRTVLSARCSVFRVRCSFMGEALRFVGAAHLCLSDSELSGRERLDDKTVQLTYRKHIFLGCAAVLQVRCTVLSVRCSVFRVRCSFTERCSVLRGFCIFVSVRLSTPRLSTHRDVLIHLQLVSGEFSVS